MKRELAVVGSAAALLTTIVAWPVVRSPRTLVFGNEIVGRHGDPFVVMQQFSTWRTPSPYWQPVTDVPGALLAHVVSPIAAYNLVVLLTFPLTVLAAYALTAPRPVVATVEVSGFHEREGNAADAWRWMGSAGSWCILNTSDHVVIAQVEIDLSAFPGARHVRIEVDQRELDQVLDVAPQRATQTIGPVTLTPGEHLLSFRNLEPASTADAEVHNGDPRLLTLRFGHWQWHVLAS